LLLSLRILYLLHLPTASSPLPAKSHSEPTRPPNPPYTQTLWGGWAIRGNHSRFWFAGDTGYAPCFKEIGARLGPFDLAAIPIGAYEPRAFMAPQVRVMFGVAEGRARGG